MQAWKKENITFSKPSSYDGRKRVYVLNGNSGLSDSNLDIGKGIQIRQLQDKSWAIVATFSGFKDHHYTSGYEYRWIPSSLRLCKAMIIEHLTDQIKFDELLQEISIMKENKGMI